MKKTILTLAFLSITSIVGIVHGHLHLIKVRAQTEVNNAKFEAQKKRDLIEFITDCKGCSHYEL